ncbi:MAG: HAD family phosphatase [Caldilineaceae bacterium]|nr:HAD family phosphatase [Caldilineaceae bacterium]
MSETIQVLALDMDETLLGGDGRVSPRTEAALARWLDAGRRVVIATGRPPRSIPPALPPLLQAVPRVSYNGAMAHVDGHLVHADLIDCVTARAIVEQAQARLTAYAVALEIGDVIYLDRPLPKAKRYVLAPDLAAAMVQSPAKVLLFPTGDEATLQAEAHALAELLAALPDTTLALRSNRFPIIQIMSHTADKANALTRLLAGWGQSLDHAAAFGDDINDVEMVRRAGLGVAVANAVPEVLAVADRVTASNIEDGVALVVEELLAEGSR